MELPCDLGAIHHLQRRVVGWFLAWPERIVSGQAETSRENARQTGTSGKAKSDRVFGQARKASKMLRAGLYARVSTQRSADSSHADAAPCGSMPPNAVGLLRYRSERWAPEPVRREARETTAGCGAAPRDRCRAGVAIGPLGPFSDGPAGNAAGTGDISASGSCRSQRRWI